MFIELTAELGHKIAVNTDHIKSFWAGEDAGTWLEFSGKNPDGEPNQVEVREPFSWVLLLFNGKIEHHTTGEEYSHAAKQHALAFPEAEESH